MKKDEIKSIAKNKKAYFDYDILENYEAGIQLFGHEVKSIKDGHVNLKGAYISFVGGFAQIKGMHITPLASLPNRQSIPGNRERKIFLYKKDLNNLQIKQKESGLSIIPLEIYTKGNLIKIKVGLCKGRKEYDKKQILKERSLDKEAKVYLKKFI